jgi:hypothetical protein
MLAVDIAGIAPGIWNEVGFDVPATPGSSVSAVASLVPFPSLSKEIVPWFVTVDTIGAGRIVAVIVMVTDPLAGKLPFQVTVFVPVLATAVPLVADAETRASFAGRTSVNSLPGLSPCVPVPPFVSVTVYVTFVPTAKLPATVFVPDTEAPGGGEIVSLSVAELLPGVGSVTPAGAVTVAVLLSVPVAAGEIVQLAV